jgi:Domain of unknown function (DUF4833)
MVWSPARPVWLIPIGVFLVAALGFPATPSGITYAPLFVIERSLNANVVHYEAKVKADGRLDPGEPVVAYWIMAAENGRRQALNLLERTKAYGFSIRPDGADDSYKVNLVADRKREIHIYRQGGAVRAETAIDGHRAYLQKIYIHVRKSLVLDTADSAELFGVDVDTAQPRSEKVH